MRSAARTSFFDPCGPFVTCIDPMGGNVTYPTPDTDELSRALRRTALTSLIGTSIEFYDFFIFATAAAIVFPKIFFTSGMSPLVALIASFSTFAIGFFARPLGAAVFGHFGDRLGRKRMLVIALLMMGGATTLIGLLPSYQVIGNFAPVLLVLLRLVQGFALGGQWGGAVLVILENAPADKRGWYGSFAQAGAPIGTVLANLAFVIVSSTLSEADFIAWGWRLPFLASIGLILLALFTHSRMEETSAFQELQAREQRRFVAQVAELSEARGIDIEAAADIVRRAKRQSPAMGALRRYPKQILLAAGTFVGMQASYYILVSFSLAFGTNPLGGGMATTTMLMAVLCGAIAMVPGVFIGAAMSDRTGRRGVVMGSAILLACWSFAIFPMIGSGSLLLAALALMVGQFLNGMIFGPLAALFTESFATQVRYSGMSLAYQLGTLVGGALAPMIATALFAHYGSAAPISLYVATMCCVSAISAWAIRESFKNDIRDDAGDTDGGDPVAVASFSAI
ncbi:MAG: MFS transporter [Sphingobium sp.]